MVAADFWPGLGQAEVWGWVQDTETLGGVSRDPVTVVTVTSGDSSVTGVFHGMLGVLPDITETGISAGLSWLLRLHCEEETGGLAVLEGSCHTAGCDGPARSDVRKLPRA